MSEQKHRARMSSSILDLDRELDLSVAMERERQRRDRAIRDIMNSNESIERMAVKSVAAGLLSYVQHEDLYYSSGYKRKNGLFGSSDEEWTNKRIKRLIIER